MPDVRAQTANGHDGRREPQHVSLKSAAKARPGVRACRAAPQLHQPNQQVASVLEKSRVGQHPHGGFRRPRSHERFLCSRGSFDAGPLSKRGEGKFLSPSIVGGAVCVPGAVFCSTVGFVAMDTPNGVRLACTRYTVRLPLPGQPQALVREYGRLCFVRAQVIPLPFRGFSARYNS